MSKSLLAPFGLLLFVGIQAEYPDGFGGELMNRGASGLVIPCRLEGGAVPGRKLPGPAVDGQGE